MTIEGHNFGFIIVGPMYLEASCKCGWRKLARGPVVQWARDEHDAHLADVVKNWELEHPEAGNSTSREAK